MVLRRSVSILGLALWLALTLSMGCSQGPGKSAKPDPKPGGSREAEADVSPIQTVAVVPLAAEGAEWAWLGEAVAAGLNHRLFDRPDVGSYTTRQVEAGMRQARVSPADLGAGDEAVRVFGRHLGAQYVVLGELAVAGDVLDGQARIVEVSSGKEQALVKLAGPVGAFPKQVDAIAAELVKLVGGELKATPSGQAGPPLAAREAATRALMLMREQSLSPRAANPQVDLQVSAEGLAEARKLAGEATEAAPGYACAWVALALGEAMAGDTDKATELLAKASELAPRDGPLLILVRNFVLMRQGRFDVAEGHLRKAVEAHPGFLHARGTLAEVLLHFGRLRESRAVYKHYLALAPGQAWVMTRIGYTHSKLGDDEAALAQTREALALVPDSTYLLTELASRQIDASDLPGAQASLEKVLGLDPDHARALLRLGYVKLRTGDDDGAIAASQKVLETAKGSRHRRDRAYAHLNLARAYGHQGKVDEALEQLRLARKEAEISLDEFELDETLEPVRQDPRYMQILD